MLNEFACRLADPKQFVRFRRENGLGQLPDQIFAFRADGTAALQAFRYPKETWTEEAARAHCDKHGGQFEPPFTNGRLLFANATVGGGKVRKEQRNGRSYVVAPITFMVEGVHAGNLGPEFYSTDLMSTDPMQWDGTPLTVRHPHGPDGSGCLLSDAIDWPIVGSVNGPAYEADATRLRAEAWLDELLSELLIPTTFAKVMAGEPVEVSTGFMGMSDGVPGIWKGEAYNGSITSWRRDHIAIIPDWEGACSGKDGCGILANGGMTMSMEKVKDSLKGALVALEALLTGQNGDKTVITNASDGDQGEGTMAGDKKKELVTQLCACGRNKLTEADATSLMALPEEVLTRMLVAEAPAETEEQKTAKAAAAKAAESVTPPAPTAPVTEPIALAKAPVAEMAPKPAPKPLTAEEYINAAPPELRPGLMRGLQRDRQVKSDSIKGIMANDRNRFTEAELAAMDVGQLERLAELAQVVVDYSGAIGAPSYAQIENADAGPGPAPKVWDFSKKEKAAA